MSKSVPKPGPNTMSYSGPSAVNPIMESPYIPSSESAHSGHSGRSSSPEHPGERVADSSLQWEHPTPQHSSSKIPLAMQYVNHANMPTTGYAYAAHGRLQGVTDVDVDEKTGTVYESMAEVQTQRRLMNGGMNVHVEAGKSEDKYAGIPNRKANRSTFSSTCCILKTFFLVFLFVLSAGAFALSVYNFLQKDKVGVVVTDAPTQSMQTGTPNEVISRAQFVELNNTVAELRTMLEQISAKHENRYENLNTRISSVEGSTLNVSGYSNELNLYSGCKENTAVCIIDHNQVGTPPSSRTCETATFDLEEEGYQNVNIYCSVDNTGEETNPIVATLNIFGGKASCLCSLIAPSSPPIYSPPCHLVIQRCPTTVRLNNTS